MNSYSLSRRESTLLKGLAIFAIFLHNYCHWMPKCVPENEYAFSIAKPKMLVEYIIAGGPHLVMNLFSFFGHYGVPVFLFVSGYGLVKKYESGAVEPESAFFFYIYNAKKLWKLLLPGIMLYILIHAWHYGWQIKFSWWDVLAQATFVTNLMTTRPFLLGPWWYFSLTLQLYVLYRLVFFRFRSVCVLLLFAVLCIVLQAAAMLFFDDSEHRLLEFFRYNFIGCMLPFLFGVWMGRGGVRLPVWIVLPSLVLLVVFSFNAYLWLLTPLLTLGVALPLAKIIPNKYSSFWLWLGGVSSSLFVVHPLVRWVVVGDFLNHSNKSTVTIYLCTIVYVVACLFVSWLYQKLQNAMSGRKK